MYREKTVMGGGVGCSVGGSRADCGEGVFKSMWRKGNERKETKKKWYCGISDNPMCLCK